LPRTTLRRVLAPTLVLALILAGCGGDDAGDTADEAATAPTEDAADGGGTDGDDADADGDDETDPTSAPEGEVASSEPVASDGCGTSTVGAVELDRRELDGDRHYLVTTPTAHDGETPIPLVVDFHGLSEGAEVHAMQTQLGPYGEEEGFAVAFPHGTDDPVRWNTTPDREGNPDLVYVEAVLDDLGAEFCIDTSRIYATGLSNGAMMSSAVACALADRFAAVAPVAGITDYDGCDPTRPVPINAFHGTVDPILLFNGGVDLSVLEGGESAEIPEADIDGEGYPATAAVWAARNGCEEGPTDDERSDTLLRRTWDCPADAPVVFDIIDGHGHGWPGSEFSVSIEDFVGPTDLTVDANEEMWRFFQRFALPAT
jgi:polyhydroxybutyrate depolymerase